MYLNSQNPQEIDLKNFQKGKRISRRGNNFVYKVSKKGNGDLYAAKVLDCGDDEAQCNKMIEKITEMINFAHHPTILNYIWYSKVDFQEEPNITLIMDYAKNRSLYDFLENIKENGIPINYTNTSRQKMIIGIARGMKYLHNHNIIHGNLNSNNILLDSEYLPHISDFFQFTLTDQISSQTQYYNILTYKAPETFCNHQYDKKSDVYSFGIIIYEIITDSKAFPEIENKTITDFEFKSRIVNENYHPEFGNVPNSSLRELIERCCSKERNDRPTFDEIFDMLSNSKSDSGDQLTNQYFLTGVIEDEFNNYVEFISKVDDEADNLIDKISKLEKENEDLNESINDLKSNQLEKNQELKKFETKCEQLKAHNKELNATIQEQNNKIAKMREDYEKL